MTWTLAIYRVFICLIEVFCVSLQKILLMNIFDTVTPDTFVEALQQRMERLATTGGDEVVRLREEVSKSPKDPEAWFDLGVALNQAALQYTDLAVRLAEFQMEQTQPSLDDAEDATAEEEQPIRVDVSAVRPLYEDAIAAFEKVKELEPDYYGLLTQIGNVYGNLGNLQQAEQCYLHALEEDEEDFSAAYYLGCTYRDMGDEEKAARYFDLAKQLNPDDVTFCNCQGQNVEQ